ncbi:MAG: hypothetical protein R3C25_05920 [Hyphomonadaceae bacterium]
MRLRPLCAAWESILSADRAWIAVESAASKACAGSFGPGLAIDTFASGAALIAGLA